MSATDPLREAFRAALDKHKAGPPHAPWYQIGAEDQWRSNLLDDLEAAAREALAAVPAEPEAWEWRATLERPEAGTYHSAPQGEQSARSFAASLARDVPHGTTSVERRRAPGQWERVDPGPRLQDGGEHG